MAAEDFFSRWAKRKAQPQEMQPADPAATPAGGNEISEASKPKALPTLADVEQLSSESDYSAFMAQGVDESVRRSAMKKLFSDPHFNVMDGLDVYIDDYNKFEPVPPEMLAALNHAKGLLDPLPQLEKPLMRLIEQPDPAERDAAAGLAASSDLQTGDQADADGPADGQSTEARQSPPAPADIQAGDASVHDTQAAANTKELDKSANEHNIQGL